MAASNLKGKVAGQCIVDVIMNSREYAGVQLGVFRDLCADVILGQDFQARHRQAVFKYGRLEADLVTVDLETACSLLLPRAYPRCLTIRFQNVNPLLLSRGRFNAEDK